MVKLTALHIIRFRNDDECSWVMQQILNFIVDILSHNPQLPLEYIAIDNNKVERVRRSVRDESGQSKTGEGQNVKLQANNQQSESMAAVETDVYDPYLVMPSVELYSDDEGDESGVEEDSCLKLESASYSLWRGDGPRIFSDQLLNGTL